MKILGTFIVGMITFSVICWADTEVAQNRTIFHTLNVHVIDVDNSDGFLAWSLYDKAVCFETEGFCPAFAENLGIRKDRELVPGGILAQNSDGIVDFTIPNVPDGDYVLTIYHDKNEDGLHNRNILRMPREDFGVSQIEGVLWHTPTWEESKFPVNAQEVKKPTVIHMDWYKRKSIDE